MSACVTCAYWRCQTAAPVRCPQGAPMVLVGECRRNAPYPKRGTYADSGEAVWPTTLQVDWCGEFRANEGAAS